MEQPLGDVEARKDLLAALQLLLEVLHDLHRMQLTSSWAFDVACEINDAHVGEHAGGARLADDDAVAAGGCWDRIDFILGVLPFLLLELGPGGVCAGAAVFLAAVLAICACGLRRWAESCRGGGGS